MKASGASYKARKSAFGGSLKVLAVLAVAVACGLASESAVAAHPGQGVAAKPVKEATTPVAAKDVETTSSIGTNVAGDPYCNVSRKRLFVEGEGWIVRRVTTCY